MAICETKPAKPFDFKKLSDKLEVEISSLEKLEMKTCRAGYVFPMKNAIGDVIGFRIRYFNSDKYGTTEGSNLGLFIPATTKLSGSVRASIIVEGVSDTAAGLDANLPVIGRPDATSCVSEIVRYFEPQRFNGIVVVADNDENKAGVNGANKLADALLEAGHLVKVILPPEPYGDLRKWHQNTTLTYGIFCTHADKFSWKVPNDTPPGFFCIGNWQVRSGLIKLIGVNGLAVLMEIAAVRGKNNLCQISAPQIEEKLGISRSTVFRALKLLREHGILETVTRGNGRLYANVYRIHLEPFNYLREIT